MSDGLDFETVEKLMSFPDSATNIIPELDFTINSNTAKNLQRSNTNPTLTSKKGDLHTIETATDDSSKNQSDSLNNRSANISETNENLSSSPNDSKSKKVEKSTHRRRRSPSTDEKADNQKHSSLDATRSPSRRKNSKTHSPNSSKYQRSNRSHRHRHHSPRRRSSSRHRSPDRHKHRRSRSSRSRSVENDNRNGSYKRSISSRRNKSRNKPSRRNSRSSSSSSSRIPKRSSVREKGEVNSIQSSSTSIRNNNSYISASIDKTFSTVTPSILTNGPLQTSTLDINNLNLSDIDKTQNEEELRRKREIEEARRDDLTVLILNLNLNATERDIYEFFAEHAGKVRDIQTIKDQRSGRAKGVAYIEFYQQASVIKALSLSGQLLKGQPIRVQASQAEKNRAAKAAKIQQSEFTDGPMKLFVGGFVDVLSNISPEEIKQIFSPFGEILSVEIQRDPYTGRSKGFAFVQFKHASEAKEAMSALSGYVLAGRPLKIGYATEPSKPAIGPEMFPPIPPMGPPLNMHIPLAPPPGSYIDPYTQQIIQQQQDLQDSDRLDDDGGGYLSGPGSKLLLMQKLQRGEEVTGLHNLGVPLFQPQPPPIQDSSVALAEQKARMLADQAYALTKPNLQPYPSTKFSQNIILHGMFSASDPAIKQDPEFFSDLIDEARTECSTYGVVQNVYIKQNLYSLDGTIWVRFGSIEHASKAYSSLHGRYFAGNPIRIEFADDAQWAAYCK